MRAKGSESTEEELTISEIREISQTVANMEVLQQEESNFHSQLVQQTDKINASIVTIFKQFREKPVKTKSFSKQDKAMIRNVLAKFELSSDEEQVNLEGIQLGDGTYEKVSQFSNNVHKLQKLLEAKQVISKIKSDYIVRRNTNPSYAVAPQPPYKRQKFDEKSPDFAFQPIVSENAFGSAFRKPETASGLKNSQKNENRLSHLPASSAKNDNCLSSLPTSSTVTLQMNLIKERA